MNKRVRSALNSCISVVLALLLSFAVIGVLLLWQGYDPAKTFLALFEGAFVGKLNLSASVVLAIPLVLGGLGIALSFRCGIFNIGGEGQLYLGAFAATWLGVNLTGLPFFIHIPICLLGSMVFGGLWALIPGWLKIKRGYNETITSVLLNYVGVYFVNYTLASFFRAEGVLNHQSPKIQTSAMLSKLMKGSELNTSLFLTLAIVILFYFIFYKTDVGFKLRMVGANAETARTSGVNTRKYLLLAIITAVISNLTLILAIQRIGSTLASILGVGEPLTAVTVGILVFDEPATFAVFSGVAVICAAVVLVMTGPQIQAWLQKRKHGE